MQFLVNQCFVCQSGSQTQNISPVDKSIWSDTEEQNKWRRVSVEICGRVRRTDSWDMAGVPHIFSPQCKLLSQTMYEEMFVDGLTSEKWPEVFES